jgi:hypothetical protein
MATLFKNKVLTSVGTTKQELVDVGPNARATIIGLSVTNLIDQEISVSVTVTDGDGVEGYFIKDVSIPTNSSLRVVNGGEKLVLPGNNKLKIYSNTDYSIDVIASYVEIV